MGRTGGSSASRGGSFRAAWYASGDLDGLVPADPAPTALKGDFRREDARFFRHHTRRLATLRFSRRRNPNVLGLTSVEPIKCADDFPGQRGRKDLRLKFQNRSPNSRPYRAPTTIGVAPQALRIVRRRVTGQRSGGLLLRDSLERLVEEDRRHRTPGDGPDFIANGGEHTRQRRVLLGRIRSRRGGRRTPSVDLLRLMQG